MERQLLVLLLHKLIIPCGAVIDRVDNGHDRLGIQREGRLQIARVFADPSNHLVNGRFVRKVHVEKARIEIVRGSRFERVLELHVVLHPERVRDLELGRFVVAVQHTEQVSELFCHGRRILRVQHGLEICLCFTGSAVCKKRQRIVQRQRRIVLVLSRVREELFGAALRKSVQRSNGLVLDGVVLSHLPLRFVILLGNGSRIGHGIGRAGCSGGSAALFRAARAQQQHRGKPDRKYTFHHCILLMHRKRSLFFLRFRFHLLLTLRRLAFRCTDPVIFSGSCSRAVKPAPGKRRAVLRSRTAFCL
ncbi:unknown [Clostridium sp. CAG:1024]|nr:unknown [Clostridium sp. CAG:1024]